MKNMMKWLSERTNYIAVFVIGYLLRGIVFHFFPPINDILMWITILWPAWIIAHDILTKQVKKPNRLQLCLYAFLAAAVISTLLNGPSYLDKRFLGYEAPTTGETILSLWQAVTLLYVMYTASNHETEAVYMPFIERLSLISVMVIGILGAGSLFLYICYVNNIALPGGFGGADQIFTYGHMGEETRFCGLFGYSTDGGNLCALSAVLCLFLYQRRKIPLWLAGCVILLSVVTIYLLDVRTSVVELAVTAVILLISGCTKRFGAKRTALTVPVILLAAIAALWFLKQEKLAEYAAMIAQDPRGALKFLTTGRSEYWIISMQEFLRHPLFGVGWLNSSALHYFDGHNLFFNLLLWTGLAGTIPIILFFILLVKRIISRKQELKKQNLLVLCLILTAVFVESMLDRAILGTGHLAVETSFFWLSAGILACGFGSEAHS